jgi:hypothetical protein
VSALAFARRVLARWDRRVVSPRPLGLVLARPPAPAPARRRPAILSAPGRHETHVHLQPRIALTIVRPTALTAELRSTTAVAAGSAASALSRVEQLVLRNTSALHAQRLVERTLARATRIELLARSARAPMPIAVPAPGTPVLGAPASLLVASPEPAAPVLGASASPLAASPARTAELVVRRPAAAAALEQAARERSEHAAFRETDATRAAAAPVVPPVDLARLTDQVVAAIDGRLTAQAERLGRS